MVARLAELASAFLAVELSIQGEKYSIATASMGNHVKNVADQVLDLFGEGPEFEEGTIETQRAGRLKPLLSTNTWQATRVQIKSFLEAATVEIRSRIDTNNSHTLVGRGTLLKHGQSSSPFRGRFG